MLDMDRTRTSYYDTSTDLYARSSGLSQSRGQQLSTPLPGLRLQRPGRKAIPLVYNNVTNDATAA